MISDKMKLQTKNCDAYSVFPDFKGKTMNIEIVNMCNEKCIYCEYSAQGLHRQGGFIDDELFYKVTKEAKELGINVTHNMKKETIIKKIEEAEAKAGENPNPDGE